MPLGHHRAAFERFHSENPQVYEHLKRLAFKLKVRGVQRWGCKALYEVLRYELAVATRSPVGTFRLNNNFTAHYARLLMELEPDLTGFFETRDSYDPTSPASRGDDEGGVE